MENQMFCFQCQETAGCSGCTVRGVCGKTAEVARMQDLLIYVTTGLSAVTTKLREAGKSVEIAVDYMVNDNLFTTITNANFSEDVIADRVEATLAKKAELLAELGNTAGLPEAALWTGVRADFAEKANCASNTNGFSPNLMLRPFTYFGGLN